MKRIFLIGGTMGVGKTTTCQILKNHMDRSVFLDGDWCWDAHPFVVTEETKAMVMDNICYLLNNFIKCTAYENIIFCWVMHEQKIIDELCARLDTSHCQVFSLSLVCHKKALKDRLQRDIQNGTRQEDIIERSTARIPLYNDLRTIKIDVSDIMPEEAAVLITNLIRNGCEGASVPSEKFIKK